MRKCCISPSFITENTYPYPYLLSQMWRRHRAHQGKQWGWLPDFHLNWEMPTWLHFRSIIFMAWWWFSTQSEPHSHLWKPEISECLGPPTPRKVWFQMAETSVLFWATLSSKINLFILLRAWVSWYWHFSSRILIPSPQIHTFIQTFYIVATTCWIHCYTLEMQR